MLMKKEESLLLIIDVQEKLAPVMDNPREIITGSSKLIGVAKLLEVPTIITEQYPKGLGPTMADLKKEAGDDAQFLSKVEFSCAKNQDILTAIKKSGKKQIVISGIETHICVTQTALELVQKGYEVFVVSNSSGSRKPVQHVMALQRMMQNGVNVVTIEMVIFEWLEKAGTDLFKQISRKYVI